jgi:hypothetical protein
MTRCFVLPKVVEMPAPPAAENPPSGSTTKKVATR